MRCSAVRRARAAIVLVGFAEPAVTNTLPSTMPRLGTSWAMPHRSTTEWSGSSPIRAVPIRCPLGSIEWTSTSVAPGLQQRLGRPRDLEADVVAGCRPRAGTRGGRSRRRCLRRVRRARPGWRRRAGPRTGSPSERRGRVASAHDGGARAPVTSRPSAPNGRPASARPPNRAPTSRRRAKPRERSCRRTGGSGSGRRRGTASRRTARRTRPPRSTAGWSISRRPTSPDELARPSGVHCRRRRRGAGERYRWRWRHTARRPPCVRCSSPAPSSHSAPYTRPRRSVSEPAHTSAGDHRAAVGDHVRPVGQVGGRLGALVAPRRARATLHARAAAVVRHRGDGVRRRPPVPAEACVGARQAQPGVADRQRWQRRIGAGRIGRIAAEAGHPELTLGALVERASARHR